MIPELPVLLINDSNPVDLVLIQNKWDIVNVKSVHFDSVGKFRADLDKVKTLRQTLQQKMTKPTDLIVQRPLEFEEIETVSIETSPDSSKQAHSILRRPNTNNKSSSITTAKQPANPLIDQTVSVIRPTEWIDCISRESKRVFVKDNWIVARILLPPIAKDSIGLKRI